MRRRLLKTTDICAGAPGIAKSRKQTVLILAYYFPPGNFSGALRAFRFAKYLSREGYTVHVISREAAECFDDCGHRRANLDASDEHHLASRILGMIQQRLLPYNDQIPWIWPVIARASAVLSQEQPAVVISTSPPVAAHLAAFWLKRRFRLKWIADFRDPLWGNPFRSKRFGAVYDAALERCIFAGADAVIANTAVLAERWKSRYPHCIHKLGVLWNGYDPEEELGPAPIPPRNFQVLAHVGGVYGGRTPLILLRAVERLLRSGRLPAGRLRIRLVGHLDTKALALDRSPTSTLLASGCLEYTGGTVPLQNARRVMAEADFLLLLDTNELNIGLQVPAKLFEYIRIGRPILALTARNSPSEYILAKSNIPNSCIYPDSCDDRVDSTLLSFLDSPTQATTASPWFWRTFDASRQVAQLASVIEGLRSPG